MSETLDPWRWNWINGSLPSDDFPKGTDLGNISPGGPQRVTNELNDRPCKTLGRARPAALITDMAATSCVQQEHQAGPAQNPMGAYFDRDRRCEA